jgi:glycosyltransferase involved in cell wall biosynthesis
LNKPFFSVIVPTYNRQIFLQRCIDSIRNQIFADWELLIVDDGSKDNTAALVNTYMHMDERIKYFYQTNKGVSAARNLGLQKASGQYLCFLDSDDEYRNDHLRFFYDQLQEQNLPKALLANGYIFKDNTRELLTPPPGYQQYSDPALSKIMSAFMPYSPCIQTVCITAAIKDSVRFNEELYLTECYDFCAKAASQVDSIHYFETYTVTLHGHDSNASSPNTLEQGIHFNNRQYEEFLLMANDPFYKEISKMNIFRTKLFDFQIMLLKKALRKKNPALFGRCFLIAFKYEPTTIWSLLGGKLLRKVISKFTISRRNRAPIIISRQESRQS